MVRPEIKQFGDRAILLEWAGGIDPEINKLVLRWTSYLTDVFADEIEDLVPAYTSIGVFLKSSDHVADLMRRLKDMKPVESESTTQNWHYQLPVCYDDEFGPDLNLASEQLGLDYSDLIRLHSAPVYQVYFIGFLPGFPYLGGLDRQLWLARKASPRPRVPKGSVGIAGQQTGIYPTASPGGWNLIGNCPIPLFEPESKKPALLQPGDALSFEPVGKEEYLQIRQQCQESAYKIVKHPINA